MVDMTSPRPPATGASIQALREATTRLEAAVSKAIDNGGPAAFTAPSRLPDWTVGHVVTHLARNADGLGRVLVAAQAGKQVQPYDSPQVREDDIQAGAQRDSESIAADLRGANHRLAETIDLLPHPAWSAIVDLGRGGPTTADVILSARLAEVETHHHDLGVDDGLALLDDARATRLLAALLRSYVRTRGVDGLTLQPNAAAALTIGAGGQQIAGAAIDLVGWLSGRSDGSMLRTAGPLPNLPTW